MQNIYAPLNYVVPRHRIGGDEMTDCSNLSKTLVFCFPQRIVAGGEQSQETKNVTLFSIHTLFILFSETTESIKLKRLRPTIEYAEPQELP